MQWSQKIKPGPEFFGAKITMMLILTKSMMAKIYIVPWTDQRCSQELIWPKIWRRIHCRYLLWLRCCIKACKEHSLYTMALILGRKPPNSSNPLIPWPTTSTTSICIVEQCLVIKTVYYHYHYCTGDHCFVSSLLVKKVVRVNFFHFWRVRTAFIGELSLRPVFAMEPLSWWKA